MGYTTTFKGELRFAADPSLATLRQLKAYFGADMRELDCDYAKQHGVNYIDLELTEDLGGIQWNGAEKCYGMVAAINWLIAKVRQETDPAFTLTGEMKAQGEDTEDRWLLRMVDGVATKVAVDPKGLKVRCPDCGTTFWVDPQTGRPIEDDE